MLGAIKLVQNGNETLNNKVKMFSSSISATAVAGSQIFLQMYVKSITYSPQRQMTGYEKKTPLPSLSIKNKNSQSLNHLCVIKLIKGNYFSNA